MKKTLVAIFFAALAALFIVLIIKPDLLDRLEQADVTGPPPEPASVEQTGEPPSPPPAAAPEKKSDPHPERPAMAEIRLSQVSGRSVYVNGTDQTGNESCQVPPGRTVVATWDSDSHRFSHEILNARTGESLSPAAALEQASPASAWTGFQGGPPRTGLADAGGRDGLILRWEGRVEDGVRSSPVIRGGMAFLASDTCFVRAVDLVDGSLIWSTGIVGSKVNPVAVGEYVFAGNDVGRFEGLRAAKGKVKGTISLGSGLSGLSAISDDLLLAATSNGMLLAVETRKNMVGRLPLKYQWVVTIPEYAGSTATPLILGDRAILQTAAGKLLALALADGSVIWPAGTEISMGAEDIPDPEADMTFRFAGSLGFLTPTPAAEQGMVYAAHGDRLRAVDADDGSLLWEREISSTVSSSVSLAWGTIYLGCNDGSVHAFCRRDGLPLFRTRCGDDPIFASPVLFDGQLLIATGEGKLVLLDAFSGKRLAEDNTLAGTPIDATPAVWTGGILAVNRDGAMACFE